MNPVAMTIINPRKEYWPGIEHAIAFSQVLTKLRDSAGLLVKSSSRKALADTLAAVI